MRVKLLLFCLLTIGRLSAQTVFDKHVNVSFNSASFIDVLDELSELTAFDYAFNPKDISGEFTFTAVYKDTAVFYVLKELCIRAEVNYRQRGGYWLIVPKKESKNQSVISVVKGRVKTTNSQQVKIEEKSLKLQSYSDTAGNYVLMIPSPEFKLNLEFNVTGYDTRKFPIKATDQQAFVVKMKSNQDSILAHYVPLNDTKVGTDTVLLPSIYNDLGVKFFVSDKLKKQTEAVKTVQYRFGNVSVLPSLSLYGRSSGENFYKFSFNLLGGYSAGHNGVEVGFMNINRFNVKGLQLSLLGNVNGGQTKAWQFATVYNVAKLGCNGLQMSVLYNRADRMMKGVQLSSFINSSNGYVSGVQVAALANVARESVKGGQVSLVNWSDSTNGAQIAIVNRSKRLKGVQIGVINIVDSISKGVSIAPVNLIKGGYVALESTVNEQSAWMFKFNSGVKNLYGVVTAGVDFQKSSFKMGLGLGAFLVDRKIKLRGEAKWEKRLKLDSPDEYVLSLPVVIPIISDFYCTVSPSVRMYKSELKQKGVEVFSSKDLKAYWGGEVGFGWRL